MAQTKFEEFELSEKYGRWIQCLRDHEPIIVPDVEAIKEEMPDEYMLYHRLDANAVMAVPFWKGPTGFLTLRNAKKYKNQTGFLRMLNYAVISSLNEYFLLETRKLTIISPRITNATDVYISLFGELKITTEKGVLTEQELKSPKIARLLVYLLLKGKMTASPREIASAIWPGEDIEAAVKNIKGLVYRFRQTFELLSDYRLIESTPTGYQINPRLNVFTDFQLFDKKWSIAMKAADHKEKVEFLKKAIDLYQGPLFGSARDEHWIMSKVVAFEYRYKEIVKAYGDERFLSLDDENYARLKETLSILTALEYIRPIEMNGMHSFVKLGNFKDFDRWHDDRVREEKKLSRREWRIAIFGALVGLIPFVISTVIPWITTLLK